MKNSIFLFACLCIAFSAFAQNSVHITFEHAANGTAMALNQTEFPIWNDKMTRLTRAEFYISEIELVKADGSTVPLEDYYILANANEPNKVWDAGQYDVDAIVKVRFGIGVDEAVNHLDPTTYDADHPLAPQDPSMHWGWQAGYRFMAIEGWVDKDANGSLEAIFQYHNLDDALYRTLEMDCNLSAENGVLNIPFTLDYSKLFSGLTMDGNVIQHGSDTDNTKMMNNTIAREFFGLPNTTNSNELNLEPSELTIAPNPSQVGKNTTIDYIFPTSAGDKSIQVFNNAGQLLFSENNIEQVGQVQINTSGWATGMYNVILLNNTQAVQSDLLIIQ